ncbi:uncharacterized protein [Palaemon carinicauda]|uniref:uncharacterized protein n=1 Tax=Palaemon carinicauda TaxID=392227 RepID=UPI0035B6253C
MIKRGAAAEQLSTSAEIDHLSVVDIFVLETSRGSGQTPVPVAAVAEGSVSPSEHTSRAELNPTASSVETPSRGSSLVETPLRRPLDGRPADPTAPRGRIRRKARPPLRHLSGDRSRSPSEDGRPSEQRELSPRTSTSKAADVFFAPPETATAQSPGPSGSQGLERETAPLALKRKAPPALPPAVVPDVPEVAPRRSPLGVRASVPASCQGSPARPCPPAPRRPPAVPEVARKRPTAQARPAPDIAPPCSPVHTRPVPDMAPTRPPMPQRPPAPTRPPAPRRPPVPVSSRAVQEVPELAHRHPQVPEDSSRPWGDRCDTRPSAIPALTRTPSRPPREARDSREVRDTRDVHDARPRTVPAPASTCTQRDHASRRLSASPQRAPSCGSHRGPPKQRTPVRPVPDVCYARPRSPAQLAHPQASKLVLPDRRQTSRPQAARDPAPALSHPRPDLPDTGSGAPVISCPSEPHQVAVHPRVRPPPVPAPDRHTPTQSPTCSRDQVPAQAAVRTRSVASVPQRHRSQPTTCAPSRPRARDFPIHALPIHALPIHALPIHALPIHALPIHALPIHARPCSGPDTRAPARSPRVPKDSKTIPKSSARIRQEQPRAIEEAHVSPQEEPLGTGDFAASPSGGEHQESEHAFCRDPEMVRSPLDIPCGSPHSRQEECARRQSEQSDADSEYRVVFGSSDNQQSPDFVGFPNSEPVCYGVEQQASAKKLWPAVVAERDFEGFDPSIEDEAVDDPAPEGDVEEIISIGRSMGLIFDEA